ncbi:MAG: hypothetical protein FJW31_07790 [Acidobacteria bacterium]|nr:hypothetical protein [Acidobacteriota bacterium]
MSAPLRKTLFVLLMAAVAVYAASHLRGPNGLVALFAKQEAISQLEDTTAKLAKSVEEQEKRIQAIRDKKSEVVIPLIRSRTNWVRQGEFEFHLNEKEKKAGTPAAAPAAQ